MVDGDKEVGRMYFTSGGMRGDGYAWFIYGTNLRGFAPTRDKAAAAFRARCERWLAERR